MHKRKERKLKNSDELSAYILVTHALSFAKWRQQIFMLLHLRMSPYAYAYRTCKHPCAYACAYAYACVVRVNQALVLSLQRNNQSEFDNSFRTCEMNIYKYAK